MELPTSAAVAIGRVDSSMAAEIRSFPDVGSWKLKSKFRNLDFGIGNPKKGGRMSYYGLPTFGIWKLGTGILIPRNAN